MLTKSNMLLNNKCSQKTRKNIQKIRTHFYACFGIQIKSKASHPQLAVYKLINPSATKQYDFAMQINAFSVFSVLTQ